MRRRDTDTRITRVTQQHRSQVHCVRVPRARRWRQERERDYVARNNNWRWGRWRVHTVAIDRSPPHDDDGREPNGGGWRWKKAAQNHPHVRRAHVALTSPGGGAIIFPGSCGCSGWYPLLVTLSGLRGLFIHPARRSLLPLTSSSRPWLLVCWLAAPSLITPPPLLYSRGTLFHPFTLSRPNQRASLLIFEWGPVDSSLITSSTR